MIWSLIYKKIEVKSFDKWLYSICTNCFRDTYRKKLRGVQEVQFDSNEHKDSFMNSIACDDEYEEKDYSALYNAINKLPNKLKETISLRYFSDLSCNDIAEILGISLSAVTTRLSRAIKQLATEMNREERR